MRAFFRTLVRFFLTGVASLLPFVVTVFVVTWVLKIADAYIGPSSHFGRFLVTLVGDSHKYPGYVVGYLVVGLLIILLGFLVTRATVGQIRNAIDNMFARIPLVGKIYAGVGQVVDLFGKKDESSLGRFGGVGYVRIGNMRMVGLLTSGERYTTPDGRDHLLVFIPNSPIPMTGFNILVPVRDFHHLDIPVEEMLKLLMSLGILGPQVLKQSITRFNGERVADERQDS